MATMLRPTILTTVLLAAAFGAACGDDDPPTTPSGPDPVAVSETFPEVLNPNGGRTHPFFVDRAGNVTATITAITPEPPPLVGLALGTWNGSACTLIVTNDNAQVGQTLTATATGAGGFCVRLYDTGRLTQTIDYSVTVTHF